MYPVLFQIGPMQLRSYGLLIFLGFVLAIWWSRRAAHRYGIAADDPLDFVLLAALMGLVVSRLVYVVFSWKEFAAQPIHILYVWEGGLSFHGAVIGGGLAVAWIAHRKGIPFLKIADLLAPGVSLAYSIGRIGCFLGGCCYGVPTSLPWACSFQDPFNPPRHTPPSHPTQLYSTLANLLIFALLARMQRAPHPTGKVFWAFITLHGVYRFIVEFWRVGATSTIAALGLSEAQWVSLAMILIGGWMWRKAVREALDASLGRAKPR